MHEKGIKEVGKLQFDVVVEPGKVCKKLHIFIIVRNL